MTDLTEQDINVPVGFESQISTAKGMGEAIGSDPTTGELKESLKPFTFPFKGLSYSTNVEDYEGLYDPEKQQLEHIPGYGVFALDKRFTPQEKADEKLRIVLDPSNRIKFQDLPYNNYLMDKYKNVYKAKYGKEFEGTNEEAAMAYVSEYNFIEENLEFGLAKEFFIDIPRLDDETKNNAGALFLGFEQLKSTGKGSRPFGVQFGETVAAYLSSPSTYVGIGTLGAGFLAKGAIKKGAVKVAKEELIDNYKKSLLGSIGSYIVKRPVRFTAVEGGAFMGGYDALSQGIDIRTGLQEQQVEAGLLDEKDQGFDTDQFLVSTSLGTGFGFLLGGTVKLGAKLINKPITRITDKDRENFSLEELELEVKLREIDIPENVTTAQKRYTKDQVNNLQENSSIKLFNDEGEEVTYTVESIDKARPYNFNVLGPRADEAKNKVRQQIDALNLGDDVSPQVRGSKEANIRNKVAKEYGLEKQKVTRKQKAINVVDENGNSRTILTEPNGTIIQRVSKKKLTADDYRKILKDQDELEGIKEYNVIDKAFNRLQRNFTSSFGLGKDIAELHRRVNQRLKATGDQIENDLNRFVKIWESEKGKGASKNLTKDEKEAIMLALSSDDAWDVAKQPLLAPLLRKNDGSNWTELRAHTDKMRNRIREQTKEVYESGFIQEYKLDQNGNQILDKNNNPVKNPLFLKLKKGYDERNYLVRQYRTYLEGDKFLKQTLEKRYGEDLPAIRTYIKDKNNLTDLEADEVIFEISKQSNNRELRALGQLTKRYLGGKEGDIIKRKILGEIRDPFSIYANTVFKTKRIAEEFKFRDGLVKQGLSRNLEGKTILVRKPTLTQKEVTEKGFVPLEKKNEYRGFSLDEQTLTEVINKELGDSSSVLNNPFDAIFVDPSFKKAYDNIMNFYEPGGALERFAATSTFAFNISKTVLNPTTHTRNLYGGALQNLYNGVTPFSSNAWKKSVLGEDAKTLPVVGSPAYSLFKRVVPLYEKFSFAKSLTESDEQLLTRLVELGIVNNGLRSGLFREQYNLLKKKGPNYIKELEQELGKYTENPEKFKKAMNKTIGKLAEVYEMSDSINKISAFETEFAWLSRAFKQGTDIEGLRTWAKQMEVPLVDELISQNKIGQLLEETAAMQVKMYTPTYSELPRWSKLLRKLPLGNFVAFPLENIRNYHWTWRLAGKEAFSSNPVIRARGKLRATSATAVTFITSGVGSGIGGASLAIHGLTKDVLKALEDPDVLPDYDVGLTHVYSPIKVDPTHGRYVVATNIGYTDPFSYLSQIAKAAIQSLHKDKDLNIFDSNILSAAATVAIYLGKPFVVGATGPREILKAYETFSSTFEGKSISEFQLNKIIKGLVRAFAPGFALDINTYVQDSNRLTSYGTPVDPKLYTILGSVTSFKPKIIWIDIQSGFRYKDIQKMQGTNNRSLGNYFNDAKNYKVVDGKKYFKDEKEAVRKYKKWLDEEKRIQKFIFKEVTRGRKLGIPPRRIRDLATTSETGRTKTQAGFSRYKANLGTAIFERTKDGIYYIPDMPKKIRTLLDSYYTLNNEDKKLLRVFRAMAEKENGKRIQLKGVQ